MIVSGSDISMTRGDSESLTVKVTNKDGTKRNFVTGDKVYWTVKERREDEKKILQVVVDVFAEGNAVINIPHNLTANLEPKEYCYDVQTIFADGTYLTLVGGSRIPAHFILTPEVTWE